MVLDASAAVEVALNRKNAPAIVAALAHAEEVLAPDLIIPEATNVIWKYHQFENLDLASCERALAVAVQLPDAVIPSMELYREAFLLARATKRPAYDMFYLALARREDALFLTLDSGLRKEAARQSIRIS
jgi:predicted nucleic acid-binding protein